MLNIIRLIKNKEKYKELDEKFKAIGITITGWEYLKPSVWQDICYALCDLFKKYNFIPFRYLKKIIVLTESTYISQRRLYENCEYNYDDIPIAETSLLLDEELDNYYNLYHTIIFLNSTYLNKINKYLKVIKEPENKIKFVIAHEFGHIIDFYLSITSRLSKYCDSINYNSYKVLTSRFDFSKEIIDPIIIKKYGQLKYELAENDIGSFNNMNNAEFFAESIALNYCEINTSLSEEINLKFEKISKGS